MIGQHPRLKILLLVVVVAGALAIAFISGNNDGPAALKSGGEQEVGSDPGVVGRHDHFGLVGYNPQGDKPVRFRDARVVGVPDGMEVIGIRAVRRNEGEGFIGGWDGELTSGPGAKLDFVPINEVVLQPGEYERYYVVVSVKALRAGTFRTKGIEVDWQAGSRKGTTLFPYLIGLVVPR